jgi:hypothetical protein
MSDRRLLCLLCQGPPNHICFFLPTPAFAHNAGWKPGKSVPYVLCEACYDAPGSQHAVEACLTDLTRGANGVAPRITRCGLKNNAG